MTPWRATMTCLVGLMLWVGSVEAQLPVLRGPITNPTNEHQYYLLAPAPWTESEARAVQLGGHLVTINDAAENAWVVSTFGPHSLEGHLWLGLNDAATEGTFTWASGEPVTFTNWRPPGEPNNFTNPDPAGEDYAYIVSAAISPGNVWNDAANSRNVPFFGNQSINGVVEVINPVSSFTLTAANTGSGSGTVSSAPAGISCGADCSGTYAANTVVTLAASPAGGSAFGGWSGGGCSGTGPCSVTLSADTTVTALFDLVPAAAVALTVTSAGSGTGTVTGPGILCGTDCSEVRPAGTSATLTAVPATGSLFSGWSGGGCSGTGPCSVTLSADTTVTATFIGTAVLTVTPGGTGSGTVTSDPVGIACGEDCSEPYPINSVVSLSAVPAPGSVFDGFGGTSDCTDGVLTVAAATPCTATFTAVQALAVLTVAKQGAGTGTVTSVFSQPAVADGIDCGSRFRPGRSSRSPPPRRPARASAAGAAAAAPSGASASSW